VRKVDTRLPEKGNSNSHGARPVHLTITMILTGGGHGDRHPPLGCPSHASDSIEVSQHALQHLPYSLYRGTSLIKNNTPPYEQVVAMAIDILPDTPDLACMVA
jgi:hypothetical protein